MFSERKDRHQMPARAKTLPCLSRAAVAVSVPNHDFRLMLKQSSDFPLSTGATIMPQCHVVALWQRGEVVTPILNHAVLFDNVYFEWLISC